MGRKRKAGLEAQIILSAAAAFEIVQHVALNCWTNFFNEAFKTDIDFPVVVVREAS